MKTFGFWVLFFIAGAAVICLGFSSKGGSFSSPDMALTHSEYDMTVAATNRKLKDKGPTQSTESAGHVNLVDYHPIDPSPSSKASIRPGPIEHGTPLMPYIPKLSPPGHPKRGGYP